MNDSHSFPQPSLVSYQRENSRLYKRLCSGGVGQGAWQRASSGVSDLPYSGGALQHNAANYSTTITTYINLMNSQTSSFHMPSISYCSFVNY